MRYVTWKITFHIIGVFLMITVLVDFLSGTLSIPKYLFSGLELIGVYGLAYKNPIWEQTTWKIITSLILIFLTLNLSIPIFFTLTNLNSGLNFSYSFNFFGLLFLLLIPVKTYALYIYSFKSKDIWGT
ncbi:MAG: hypothetical protein ACJAUP_001699 [Cellvibrionaceae bacterium]|jgi:hypothetical protein